ncbi:MAG TPA: cupin domain-containing protein [Ignavibacteriaceae bacterium]|nr:cupin domain-containing protein [Ignavibacteriaceae bacterium]
MDTEIIQSAIRTNVYHIDKSKNIALHKHKKFDEVFYCIKGRGFGVLEDGEQELNTGDAFIVRENTMHSLRTESEMVVTSFLIPVVD